MKPAVAQMALEALIDAHEAAIVARADAEHDGSDSEYEAADIKASDTRRAILGELLKTYIAQPAEPKQDFWTTWSQLRNESDEHIGQAFASDPDIAERIHKIIEADALFAAPQEAAAPALADDDIADIGFKCGIHLHAPGTGKQETALIKFARAAIAKATGRAA